MDDPPFKPFLHRFVLQGIYVKYNWRLDVELRDDQLWLGPDSGRGIRIDDDVLRAEISWADVGLNLASN